MNNHLKNDFEVFFIGAFGYVVNLRFYGRTKEKCYIKSGELNASQKESLPCVKGGGKFFDFDGGIVF